MPNARLPESAGKRPTVLATSAGALDNATEAARASIVRFAEPHVAVTGAVGRITGAGADSDVAGVAKVVAGTAATAIAAMGVVMALVAVAAVAVVTGAGAVVGTRT
jgi:hypothetical protein